MGVNCWWNFCSNFKLYWSHNLAEFNHVNSKLLSGLGKSFDGAWWIHKSGMCQTFSPVTWFLCVPSFYPESENVHIWMRLIQWKSPCLLWIMIMLMVSSRVAALIRPHWHDHAGTYIPANDVLVFVDNIREDDPRIHKNILSNGDLFLYCFLLICIQPEAALELISWVGGCGLHSLLHIWPGVAAVNHEQISSTLSFFSLLPTLRWFSRIN